MTPFTSSNEIFHKHEVCTVEGLRFRNYNVWIALDSHRYVHLIYMYTYRNTTIQALDNSTTYIFLLTTLRITKMSYVV